MRRVTKNRKRVIERAGMEVRPEAYCLFVLLDVLFARGTTGGVHGRGWSVGRGLVVGELRRSESSGCIYLRRDSDDFQH